MSEADRTRAKMESIASRVDPEATFDYLKSQSPTHIEFSDFGTGMVIFDDEAMAAAYATNISQQSRNIKFDPDEKSASYYVTKGLIFVITKIGVFGWRCLTKVFVLVRKKTQSKNNNKYLY